MTDTEKKPLALGTIESILAVPDIGEDLYEVPEWGCSIKIRGLSKGQQHAIRMEASRGQKGGQPDPSKSEMLMFLEGVVEPKFGREHYHALLQKSSGVLDRILNEIAKRSGLSEDAIEEAKATFQG